mgnify:CR=1 FL=1|tara:strand:+ start:20339 stop:21676 length:1338 start_codon:yes stop_codon:yes gene_type:complete
MENNPDFDISNLIEFSKIIKDLLLDLLTTFPDKLKDIILNNNSYTIILKTDLNSNDILNNTEFINNSTDLINYVKKIVPLKFFDILYQNEDLFINEKELYFLPSINFSDLYFDTTSNKTKETFWKYLQLILFSIITNVKDKKSFGDNEKLFEAINTDEFKDKLEETFKSMENLFTDKNQDFSNNYSDISNNLPFADLFNSMNIDTSNINNFMNFDPSNINNFMNFDSSHNLPNTDTIFEHINKLINGKLGNLAKELAEETTKDLNLDMDNIDNTNDVFKQLFKNPNKLMNIVNKITGKLDEKMKDGSIKEHEILEEASELFKNMGSMPGMGNMKDIFKTMNLDGLLPKGGKFNNNAFQHMMDQNIKLSKTKERMRKKAEEKNNNTNNTQTNKINNETNNLNELNKNLSELMNEFNNNIDTNKTNKTNQNVNPKKKSNNKKKPKKK